MMVHEHQLKIKSIDSHANPTLLNFFKVLFEAIKYYQSVTRNKNLIINFFFNSYSSLPSKWYSYYNNISL